MFDENYANVSVEKSLGRHMVIRVTNINIMLNTNILGMKPTPLTFDMLYHPDLEKGRYPTVQYSLPYFTDSVKYPMDYLTSKTYSERVDLFFNKKRFNSMCRTIGTNYIDYIDESDADTEESVEDDSNNVPNTNNISGITSDIANADTPTSTDKQPRTLRSHKNTPAKLNIDLSKTRNTRSVGDHRLEPLKEEESENDQDGGVNSNIENIAKQEKENADHNVRCMLILLLPIADEFTNVFQSSYDQYILNKPSPELYTLRNIDPSVLLNPTWLPFYNYYSTRKYTPPIKEISYIKQGGTKYAVSNVIWLNDIVNHPIYRDFLTIYYEKNLEKQNNRSKLKVKLNERIDTFRGVLVRNLPPNDKSPDVFMRLFETLLQNVTITSKGVGKNRQTPSSQIDNLVEQLGNDATINTSDINKIVSAVTNPKDAAKRDSVIKMATYFTKIVPINNKLKIKYIRLTHKEIFTIVDNIVNAYIEYSLYNESADKGIQINLKDDARTFTEFYNQALYIKALRLIDDFLQNRISRFDMNEKNLDGTPKSKLELDVIRIIRTNFPYYIKLNEDIVKHIRSVVEPARRSSNSKLQGLLKNIFIPDNKNTSSSNISSDSYALVEIYNKYIANTRKHIADKFTEDFMYTGVSTVIEKSPENPSSTDTKLSGGDGSTSSNKEIPEIYVYINVIQKEEYEKHDKRGCIMNDDNLANNLKRVLFTNTMMDDSFPEVNPYRAFTFLKGSEDKTPFNSTTNSSTLFDNSSGELNVNKSNSETHTQLNAKGGSLTRNQDIRLINRNGVKLHSRIRNTHKYFKQNTRRNTRKHRCMK